MVWDKPRIIEELRRVSRRGLDLSYNSLARKKQSLVSAAAYHFGSYRSAVEQAGIAYADVTRRPRWTRQNIIASIKSARRRGHDLHWAAVTKRGDLTDSHKKRFLGENAQRFYGFKTSFLRVAA